MQSSLLTEPADIPTMYFIGVTTTRSSIMQVFPEWAQFLGIGDCRIKGLDLKIHDEAESYRSAVRFIKSDPLSLGALVTTHKIDLLEACRDLFDDLDDLALALGEVSSISKEGHRLAGHAKDPITSGLALEAFLPEDYWRTGAEVFIIGAGGAAIALSWHLMQNQSAPNQPSKIHVSDRATTRLEEMRHIHEQAASTVPVEYHHCPRPEGNDAVVAALRAGSLVVNATGLGKDAPGSPLTDAAVFPANGIAWDFNYRGNLVCLDQARAQQASRGLQIEDGWIYFIHGWTRVIAEVFHLDIPTKGERFDELSRIAAKAR